MADEILSTYEEIASFLGMQKEALRKMVKRNPDMPLWKEGRIWTTKVALTMYFRRKAMRTFEIGR